MAPKPIRGTAWPTAPAHGRSGDIWKGDGARPGTRTMTERELLLGSSFHLALGAKGDAAGVADTQWTAWGQAVESRFDGDAGGLALDGDVTTFTCRRLMPRGRAGSPAWRWR